MSHTTFANGQEVWHHSHLPPHPVHPRPASSSFVSTAYPTVRPTQPRLRPYIPVLHDAGTATDGAQAHCFPHELAATGLKPAATEAAAPDSSAEPGPGVTTARSALNPLAQEFTSRGHATAPARQESPAPRTAPGVDTTGTVSEEQKGGAAAQTLDPSAEPFSLFHGRSRLRPSTAALPLSAVSPKTASSSSNSIGTRPQPTTEAAVGLGRAPEGRRHGHDPDHQSPGHAQSRHRRRYSENAIALIESRLRQQHQQQQHQQ